jgi:hypothetical protein
MYDYEWICLLPWDSFCSIYFIPKNHGFDMPSLFSLLVNVHPKENKILLGFTMGHHGFLF